MRADELICAQLTESEYSVFKVPHTNMLVGDPYYNTNIRHQERGLMSLRDFVRNDGSEVLHKLYADRKLSQNDWSPVSFHGLKIYKGDQHIADVEYNVLQSKKGQHAHIGWAYNTSSSTNLGSRADEPHPGAFRAVVKHIQREHPKVGSISADRMSGAGQGARVWSPPKPKPQQREFPFASAQAGAR